MVRPRIALSLCLLALMQSAPARASADVAVLAETNWSAIGNDSRLGEVLEAARDATVTRFAEVGLTSDGIAATLVDLTNRSRPTRASLRGDVGIYPASVVKLFYLAALESEIERGAVKDTPELRRAVHDMIAYSYNDATAAVVDTIAGVSSGPELPEADLTSWGERRDAVNRFFASLGYEAINANQKPWCEGPYGREKQWLGPNRERRNRLTTDATARLMYEIATDRIVSPAACRRMRDQLHRDPRSRGDEQVIGFTGVTLPTGSELYSKAGWTSEVRHDVAHVRLPNGAEYVLALYTKGVANETRVLSYFSRFVVDEMLRRGRHADIVYTNGRIWTGDGERPWATAMAVGGEILLAVGDSADVAPVVDASTRRVDLEGRFVVPGMIDDHTHFLSGGAQLLGVDLRPSTSPADLARRLGEFAKRLPEGRWIVGGEWDHERWPGAPLPTRGDIDAASAGHPVLVSRLDGHMAVANSIALKLAGVSRDTQDPPGGTIVRDPKTGEPTGVLKDAAMSLVYAVVPATTPAELDEALVAAMAEAARNGVTSIQDITGWDELDAYLRVKAAGKLSVRVYARTPLGSWERQAKYVEAHGAGDHWLKLGGFKAFMDGSLGSTTAYFFTPYRDAPGTTGLLSDEMDDPRAMFERVKGADAAGLQVSVHAIGDRANAMLLDIFERVARVNGPRDRRFRIEHAQHLRSIEIGRMARDGVIASMQPYHAIDDGRWAEKRLGAERLAGTYAFRSLLDAGAHLAFGSDWTVAPISPMLGIYAAVTRRTLDDKNPNGWVPAQKITLDEALRAYTSECAYASFDEEIKGKLSPGRLADFVVLSADLTKIDPTTLRDVKVLRTIVGGREVYTAN